jgi:hypothetical protein
MPSTPPMPGHLPGFEIATKHKEAIHQLFNFAEMPIPKLMDMDRCPIEKCWRYIGDVTSLLLKPKCNNLC